MPSFTEVMTGRISANSSMNSQLPAGAMAVTRSCVQARICAAMGAIALGVKKGMIVPARLDVGNVNVQARVATIFPVADPDRHTVTVKLDLPTGAPGGAGMYAEVMINDINAKVRELPVVPKSALVWRGSLPGIYVMNDQNQRELRLVRTGDDVGVEGIAILSGLRAGERVFVQGTELGEKQGTWK